MRVFSRGPRRRLHSADSDDACFSDSLEYIQEIAGGRTVPVEVGSRYTDEEWSQRLMTVSEFIGQYILNEVRRRVPPPSTHGEHAAPGRATTRHSGGLWRHRPARV